MRVLEVNLERGWRGGERQTLWTAEALTAQGCSTDLLVRRDQPLARAARGLGLTVHEVDGSADAWAWLLRHGRRYDILHAQTAHALTACVLSRWAHARPVVATRRVAFAPHGWASRWKYRHTQGLTAISDAAAAPLEGLGLGPVVRIPSAVKPWTARPERTEALRRQWVPDGWRVLGTAAALTPEKDALTLMAAMAELARQLPKVVLLHLGEGPLRSQLEREIARLDLGERYRLVGFQDDVAPWFDLFDGFVMSSRSEGLGSSALDAMLHGVPVAGTRAGGLSEVLAEERGWAVPVGDSVALAAAMRAMLREDTAGQVERVRRTTRAQEWVRRECSVDAMAARYRVLFETLISGKS